jgi:hypothetical protein
VFAAVIGPGLIEMQFKCPPANARVSEICRLGLRMVRATKSVSGPLGNIELVGLLLVGWPLVKVWLISTVSKNPSH